MVMASNEQAALHRLHSVLFSKRHPSVFITAHPIVSRFLSVGLKGVIAPLGQTCPHKMQFSRQYPSEKRTSGTIQETLFPESSRCVIIPVGHDLIQFPQRTQRMLNNLSFKAPGGFRYFVSLCFTNAGNKSPAVSPAPDDKNNRLSVECSGLFISSSGDIFLNSILFTAVISSCRPPNGQSLEHQILGKMR